MKTYFMLVDSHGPASKNPADIMQFWDHHGMFQAVRAALNDDFSNVQKLKQFFSWLITILHLHSLLSIQINLNILVYICTFLIG